MNTQIRLNPVAALAILSTSSSSDAAIFKAKSVADSGADSLRQAILDANATSGPDPIHFEIPTRGLPKTIQHNTPLPPLRGPVGIDGTTQSDYAATPIIELDGRNLGLGGQGLRLSSGFCTVRGLVINRIARGTAIYVESGTNVIPCQTP